MAKRIYLDRQEDREAVALALVRNGYSVRFGKEKSKTGSRYLHYVEYWGRDD